MKYSAIYYIPNHLNCHCLKKELFLHSFASNANEMYLINVKLNSETYSFITCNEHQFEGSLKVFLQFSLCNTLIQQTKALINIT